MSTTPAPRPRMIYLSHADTELAEEMREAEGRRVLALEERERQRQGRAPEQPGDSSARREDAASGARPPDGPPPSPPPPAHTRSVQESGGGGGDDDVVTMTFTKAEAKLLAQMTASHPWAKEGRRAAAQRRRAADTRQEGRK